jgi:predicted membrane chloride channel (bestrophin family)
VPDPTRLLAETKRTTALLNDARSVLRRVDKLAAMALAIDDPALPQIAEVRSAAERLVTQLGRRQQTEQRQMKQATAGRRRA